MSLFGKKKSSEERFAEGMELYMQGRFSPAFYELLRVKGELQPEADYWVACCYMAGSCKKNLGMDFKLAKGYLKQAAEAGHKGAAMMLLERFDVRIDIPEGEEYEAHHPQFSLENYSLDELCKQAADAYSVQDYVRSNNIWLSLAIRGHARSQTCMGIAYNNGNGERQDHAKANEWFHKAAAQNDINAIQLLAVNASFEQ